MGGRIFKQPNGLYGRWSSIVDAPTHWNMTKEDYFKYRMKLAEEEIKRDMELIFDKPSYCHAVDFDQYFKDSYVSEMSRKEFTQFLKDIGSSLTTKDFEFRREK